MINNSNSLTFKVHDYYTDKSTSFVTSGYSIMNILAVLYGGSDGKTKKMFENVLHLDSSSVKELMTLIKSMLNNSYKQTNLILSDGIKKSEYIERIKSICNVDKLEGNIEKINDFIEKYTNGLIQNLLDADRLNALIRDINMILINVIYFKSNWLHKFDKSMTSNDLFDGMKEKRVVKMMEQTNKFNYVISIDYKLVEMDYDDGLYTMGLVLPNEQTNQTNLQISYPQLVDLINRVGPNKVHLKLPKFTMKVKTDLNNMLKSIGLSDIYEDLNVPQIVDQKQCVSEAEQKIVIKVDEDGTELAVATSMMMLKCLPKKEEIVDFICNRPFLFYIRNKLNNAIVCLGRYA